MISSALYGIGLICRALALLFALQILRTSRSWRFVLIALGVAWIVLQPMLRFFFADISPYVTELQTPEVFLVTSVIALFTVYQLKRVLEINARHEASQSKTSEASARRQSILLDLASKPNSDFIDRINRIIEAGAKELGLSRVGLWLYNEDRTCFDSLALYNHGVIHHEPVRLAAADYPAYFAALDRSGMIVAPDARIHPATHELTASYLKPQSIHSLMDVPVRLEGKIVGILCHEGTEQIHHFSQEDQEFAHSLADLCALQIAAKERDRVEQALRASQRHLEDAQNAGQFASFRWNPATREVWCSGAIVQNLGLKEGLHTHVREDLFSSLIDHDQAELRAAISEAESHHTPFRVRVETVPLRGSRHLEIRASFNEADKVFEGTIQDITDQIHIERDNKRLEGQLIQSQKMESIGTMAGGIAHDFNNILTPILGYTDVALAEIPEDSKLQKPLQEILNSSLRAKDLVEQILLFSRRFDETREAIDMGDTITGALRLMRHTLPANIRINVDIDPSHHLIEADSTQMVQIVVNLCTNAWHAMDPDGGDLSVGLKDVYHDGRLMNLLTVRDTGTGIGLDAQERIFEPFYTTKEVGEGTGLGLSMVHGIVSKLEGMIEVDSVPGQGSVFSVYLPTTERKPTIKVVDETSATSDSASILVVDDDEAVAGILKSMLTDLGYQPDVYLDVHAALTSFRDHPGYYDVVVTDLTMPEMSGAELCQRIREVKPDIPVLILTGYSKDMVQDQLVNCGPCNIINKPLARADLAAALAKELH